MFWTGFIGTYIFIAVFIIGICFFNRIMKNLFDKFKVVICAFIFTTITFCLSLFYAILSITLTNLIASAFLCSLFLVCTWMFVEKMYQVIYDKKNVFTESDKNVCHLLAMIGIVSSSSWIWMETSDKNYGVLISISISIWIGAYVPIASIYKGNKIGAIKDEVLNNFKGAKISVWITGIICVLLITVMVSSNETVKKVNAVIESLGVGIASATLSILAIIVIIIIVQNYRRKH